MRYFHRKRSSYFGAGVQLYKFIAQADRPLYDATSYLESKLKARIRINVIASNFALLASHHTSDARADIIKYSFKIFCSRPSRGIVHLGRRITTPPQCHS